MTTALFWGPANPLAGMERDLERIFNWNGGQGDAARTRRPALYLGEDEDNLYVEAIAPGVTPDRFSIMVEDGVLRISGERAQDTDASEVRRWQMRERPAGNFEASLQLPLRVNLDAVTADYVNGVLRVTLPKADEVKPRRIAVQVK